MNVEEKSCWNGEAESANSDGQSAAAVLADATVLCTACLLTMCSCAFECPYKHLRQGLALSGNLGGFPLLCPASVRLLRGAVRDQGDCK